MHEETNQKKELLEVILNISVSKAAFSRESKIDLMRTRRSILISFTLKLHISWSILSKYHKMLPMRSANSNITE